MKKHPLLLTFIIAAVILTVGISAAYYNTKSFASDGETVLFSRDSESVTVFDYKIYYSDIENVYNKAQRYIPDKAYSTAPYIVAPPEWLTYIMY